MTEFPDPKNLSCYGTARILVEQLGGPQIARIYKIQIHIISEEEPHEHAYVIPVDAKNSDTPLNDQGFLPEIKVGTVRRSGKDVTEEILETPWSQL
ncbi:hypothetical protein A2210_02475 [Candidatus Woesebacteria bacterium RIFOXYA1_FULL_40_18]|uniref:Uncharacterized protein n=1 Tax=Candidatus Woesebacteria bacterium RIFOXYA1_FULL_40_18 TaxID=1802532 RepID=A0A1F8CJT6_9BACT|nr:MAG: hypothetical protein A2210_02475 [Candidatus Woesebacteria bacterium RIFOXYA1_FULL_40_18]